MFIDGRNIPENTVVDTDLAIIGAGATGITKTGPYMTPNIVGNRPVRTRMPGGVGGRG